MHLPLNQKSLAQPCTPFRVEQTDLHVNNDLAKRGLRSNAPLSRDLCTNRLVCGLERSARCFQDCQLERGTQDNVRKRQVPCFGEG